MFVRFHSRKKFVRLFAVALMMVCAVVTARSQSGEDDIDPIKLFELGQDAHARGELTRAVELYQEALRLRPEFPEAEYQQAAALLSLGHFEEAEKSLRRAIELRPEWSIPFALLGDLLVRQRRFDDSEAPLAKALKLEPFNSIALIVLAEMRLKTKAPRQSLIQLLGQLRGATLQKDASASIWLARGSIERALGDKDAALVSYARVLTLDANNIVAYLEQSEILASKGDSDKAIESAKAALRIAPASIYASTMLARLYLQTGNCTDALRTLDELDSVTRRPADSASLRSVIALECATGDKEHAALEEALIKEPRNPALLARLCVLDRIDDPPRAMDYCRRALEIEPQNVDFGTHYAAALVQARRFTDAVSVLQRVISVAPDKFIAHANLAIALYELKRFPEALTEYKWILSAKPETTAAYFFTALIYDKMGEYQQALAAYEYFLNRADPKQFTLEIDKVNLRLPGLRNQIKLGQGAKRKS